MKAQGATFRCFRILDTDTPTGRDFMSNQALGKPPRTKLNTALWDGVSVFRSQEIARNFARRQGPQHHIALLLVPLDGSVRMARTTDNPDHFTIWADAELLLSWVDDVFGLS